MCGRSRTAPEIDVDTLSASRLVLLPHFFHTVSARFLAAHHRIPLLSVTHNNRAYYQETMFIQCMANRHNRGITRASTGTSLRDPDIDYAKVAAGMGIYAKGAIDSLADLGQAIRRALEVVRRGGRR